MGTVCTIGAFLLLLPAVAAIAALFGLFVVVVRPIDLYNSHFAEENLLVYKDLILKDTKLLS